MSHAWVADTSSWRDTGGPIPSRCVQMSPGNEKTWEAAARDGDQTRVIRRCQREGSCEAFSLRPVALWGVPGSWFGTLWALLTRAGGPLRAGWSDDLLCESFPLMLFWTLCPLHTVAVWGEATQPGANDHRISFLFIPRTERGWH